jgi:hypothetical protein
VKYAKYEAPYYAGFSEVQLFLQHAVPDCCNRIDKLFIHSSEGTSAAQQSKKKSAVTAITMVLEFALIPMI